MRDTDQSTTSIFQKIIDIGAKREFSVTEKRYLRVTNIASILGVLFNAIWLVLAVYLSEAALIYGSNGLMGLMFLMVLVLNKKGWRIVASMWLAISAYISVLLFLYLSISSQKQQTTR